MLIVSKTLLMEPPPKLPFLYTKAALCPGIPHLGKALLCFFTRGSEDYRGNSKGTSLRFFVNGPRLYRISIFDPPPQDAHTLHGTVKPHA